MKKIAIFASGNGSNAENIIRYFQDRGSSAVVGVYCNKPGAFVLQRAENCGVPAVVFDRERFRNGELLGEIEAAGIDYIILAGFLWLLPPALVRRYSNRIINIHPSLLPKYGGKGMYGSHVHEAVISNGEKESGITIHVVNEEYDKGEILFQAKVEVSPEDTPSTLASKIHELEYEHFPLVIEQYITQKG